MHIIYAGETAPPSFTSSLFLGGITPRDDSPGWRPGALKLLEDMGYKGVVFVPENRDGTRLRDYEDQVEWEDQALNMSDQIVFWVPRRMPDMPGLTTNDEFGFWRARDPLRVVLGSPPLAEATKVRYQHVQAAKAHVPAFFSLKETLAEALRRIGDGDLRHGGLREVPLHIYRRAAFQIWKGNLERAGNRLDGARVEWVLRPSLRRDLALFWAMAVKIWVNAEQRHKGEKVISRPDIGAVVAYCPPSPPQSLLDTRVVLVREFRAPVNNAVGTVLELPSGSSFKANVAPLDLAAEELREETGIDLPPERFSFFDVRQIVAPFSTHRAYLYKVELTPDEADAAASLEQKGYVFGDEGSGERTQVVVRTIREMMAGGEVDWSTLGMVQSALA